MPVVASRGLTAAVFLAVVAAMAAALSVAPTARAQDATVFEVTITNQTNPEMIVTPGAYLVHSQTGAFWAAGQAANLGLERIAEIGDSGEAASGLGATPIDAAPANGATVTFMITAAPGDLLSTAQMLIATNDSFVGLESQPLFVNGAPVSGTFDLMAYDAGTEENADLFAGFAAGQPDPAEGMANVDNGTATSEAIGPNAQFSGAQATATITAQATPLPPTTGTGGFLGQDGGRSVGPALAIVAAMLALVAGGLVARRAMGTSR